MFEAKIKSLESSDWDLKKFVTSVPTIIWLQVEIGLVSDSSSDVFQISLCNPEWIVEQLNTRNFLLDRGIICAREFDVKLIYEAVDKLIAKFCQSKTWFEFATKLSRFIYWEFEDTALNDLSESTLSVRH